MTSSTFYARAAYGGNPHAGRNPNADNGWGGYQWPGGVPVALLARVTVPGNVAIQCRRELAELVGIMYELAYRKYGRTFERGFTGGYQNRAIAGTATPSNHSKGKAIDNDAQFNPMSTRWQCDIPPGLVHDWEILGFYWGGRYTGKTDTMHFEYTYAPTDVAGHVALGRTMLAAVGGAVPTPTPAPAATPGLGSDGNWPLPAGHYFGSLNSGQEHNGTNNQYERNYVAELQSMLNKLGYPAGENDGVFGAKTKAALTAWQIRNPGGPRNIIESHLCGANDWFAIHDPAYQNRQEGQPAATPSAFPGQVQRGSTGNIVKDVQDRLVERGLLTRAQVDTGYGTFGPRTEVAVRAFQTSAHIGVDGIVGPTTWARLHS